MSVTFHDLVKVSIASTGTGPVQPGAAVNAGYFDFVSADGGAGVANGAQVPVVIEQLAGGEIQRELSLATYARATNTLTRSLRRSTTGALLDLQGEAVLYITPHSDDLIPDTQAPLESFVAVCSDETSALSAGTGKLTFRMPYAFTLSAVRASLVSAQTAGAIFTVDVNAGGASLLSTKLTIDNGEKTSVTAAAAAVIATAAIADDAEVSIDVDQIGDGTARGLKVTLIGRRP